MRRLAAFAAVLAVMAFQSAVFADEEFIEPAWYTGDTRDKAEVNANGYCTVIITKDSDGSIVYANQAADVYTSAQTFLLKENPEVGRYTVQLGSSTGSPKVTYFYVGADSNNPGDSGDLYLKRLQNEEENSDDSTWNIGYYAMIPASAYNNYTDLKVGYKDGDTLKYGSFTLKGEGAYPTTYSGEGSLYLIFQLNNVPSDQRYSAAVYLVPSSSGGGE